MHASRYQSLKVVRHDALKPQFFTGYRVLETKNGGMQRLTSKGGQGVGRGGESLEMLAAKPEP